MAKKKKKVYKSLATSIIGLIFNIALLIIIPVFISYFFQSQLASSSITRAKKDSFNAINSFDYKASETVKKDQFESIKKINPDILDIIILDSNRLEVSSYTSSLIDYNNLKELEDGFEKTNYNIYYLNSNSKSIKLSSSNTLQCKIFKSLTESLDNTNGEIDDLVNDNSINYNILFEMKLEDGSYILVKTKAEIYTTEIVWTFGLYVVILMFIIVLSVIGFIHLIKDILHNRKMKKVIFTSIVTDGFNYTYFKLKAAKIKKKAYKKDKEKYAIVHLRLEKFRSIVLCYGNEQANIYLKSIHDIIKNNLVNKEMIVHKEKSDFALLLEYTDSISIREKIQNIINIVKNSDIDAPLDFSAGIAEIASINDNIDDLYNNACIARGNTTDDVKIVFFDKSMQDDKKWEIEIEADMNRALANEEFKVYLQAKYTPEHTLGGAEALIRWIHPEKGFISPGKFIPIFEKNGFIMKIDDYMLEHICILQAKWYKENKKIVPISVNISRAHFTQSDLAKHITAIVDKYKVPHEYIELELTESAFFDDKKTLITTVKALKKKGFKISMDDFGAGYSSLNSLKELDIDVLKLDAEFFSGKNNNTKRDIIVSEAIQLAKKLNMKIVAEGIEKPQQVEILKALHCDLIQGYVFAKPIEASEYEQKVLQDEK